MTTDNPRDWLVHPADQLIAAMERIYRYRMTTTSGGNLSICDEDGDIWITPAKVDKGSLRRGDIVRVATSGQAEGLHPPSSEFPFHRAIYAARPDFGGIVHAHPVALVAFSICGRTPDTRLFHQAKHICSNVGFAPYALPGSEALARNIAESFAAGHECVVLENHGVVVGGATLREAFQRFETLEFTAQTIIRASMLGEVHYLTDEQAARPRSIQPLPEFDPPVPTSREKELRRQLCEFVRRGYQQRLLISTEGSFSARLDAESFLVTPSGVDRSDLSIDELVLVRGAERERGKTPSRAAWNHRAIYERHPHVQSIVCAYPVNATAFSATGHAFDSRTIPESYLLLGKVGWIPYGEQLTDGRKLAAHFSRERPVALVENDGAMVCGTSVLDAFDRLEVLETTAEAITSSRVLGELTPMPPGVIDELDRAFLQPK